MTTIYPLIMGREAMVSTEHYFSASAGAGMFARGGNAIDAANAERVIAVNGNMVAPAKATIAHYRNLGMDLVPGEGLLAAGVPAAFDALAAALGCFGTLTLADVVEPVLKLCEDGMPMH